MVKRAPRSSANDRGVAAGRFWESLPAMCSTQTRRTVRLGLYYRPKEGRDPECEVATWIKEGWQWVLNRALGLRCRKPDWFRLPVMRRIAITTPNVMAALRHLRPDQARPYNFALSPVLVNLAGTPVTLLAPFEKDSSRWMTMPHINIHDGTSHTLDNPALPLLVQTFEMVFQQYHRHPES